MQTNNFQPPAEPRDTVGGKSIRWVNGVPEPYYVTPVNAAAIKTLATVAAALPYEGKWDEDLGMFIVDPRFKGMTNAEVMWIRTAEKAADGDLIAANMLLDRILGKPKQSVESTSMSMSYQEFLNMVEEQERKNAW